MRKDGKGNHIRSAVVIARLLSTEGFTDHVANQVESYWKRAAGLTDRQRTQLGKVEASFSEIASTLTVAQRLVIGRFIGLHKKMSFETGLRIGLQTYAQKVDKDVEKED